MTDRLATDELLYSLEIVKRGDKIVAFFQPAGEEKQEMDLPEHMASQIPIALAMMKESLG